jgi:hypothetical protein
VAGPARNNRIASPSIEGTSPVKYKFRFNGIGGYFPFFNFLDYYVYSLQTIDVEPDDDPAMTPLQDLFNQDNTYLITFID